MEERARVQLLFVFIYSINNLLAVGENIFHVYISNWERFGTLTGLLDTSNVKRCTDFFHM